MESDGKEIKICIGMATTGVIKTFTGSCLIKLIKRTKYATDVLFKNGCLIHDLREKIARYAVRNDFTHLLFVDNDMIFPPDALDQLLESDKDIIGVNSYVKSLEKISTVKLHEGKEMFFKPSDGLFECCGVGTGFMLIKTKVFNKIPHPWFFFKQNDGHLVCGEDVWFCREARKAGFKIWCDPTIIVKHIGDYEY